jgi:hypothetical protein
MQDDRTTDAWEDGAEWSAGGGPLIHDYASIAAMKEAYLRDYAARGETAVNTLLTLKNGMWLTLLAGSFLMFFLLDLMQEGLWFLG